MDLAIELKKKTLENESYDKTKCNWFAQDRDWSTWK